MGPWGEKEAKKRRHAYLESPSPAAHPQEGRRDAQGSPAGESSHKAWGGFSSRPYVTYKGASNKTPQGVLVSSMCHLEKKILTIVAKVHISYTLFRLGGLLWDGFRNP